MKRAYKNIKMRRSSDQQQRTNSDSRPADQSLINRSSTGCCVHHGFHRVSFIRVSEEISNFLFLDALESKRVSCFLGGPTAWYPIHPALPRPTAPPCAAPPRPARGVSNLRNRQILFAYDIVVRASEKNVLDRFPRCPGGHGGRCFSLGASTRRRPGRTHQPPSHPTLLRPAPPRPASPRLRRRLAAVHRPAPSVVCPRFSLKDLTRMRASVR